MEEGEQEAREGQELHVEKEELDMEKEGLLREGNKLNRSRRGTLSSLLGSWYRGSSS